MMHSYTRPIRCHQHRQVLILVVMDDALVQEVKSILVEFFNVLILVLMDDALVRRLTPIEAVESTQS